MGAVERIWLVQTPSTVAQAWREALGLACVERGWDFAIHERGDPPPIGTSGRSLLIVAWFGQAEGPDLTHCAVQLSPPLEAVGLLKSEWGLNEHDACYEASVRLATAWELVESGAGVSWSDEADIELGGLGRVSGPQDQMSATCSFTDHPLSMFERGRAAGMQVTQWKPDVFLYPDARPSDGPIGSLPLVGRRRLLLNGPNIFLPAGLWRFVAEISIDPPGKTELLVDWGHGHDVASLVTPIDISGRYELSLEKHWTEVQPADFRISLMIPALDGEFCFHGGRLTRQPI